MMSLACPAWMTPRFRAWAVAWTAASLLAYGLVTAIIPNPVFGRQIPPQPFAIAIWLLSGPLMGIIVATYSVASTAPAAGPAVPVTLGASGPPAATDRQERRTTTLGTLGGFGTFLAIGCPVCNKIALLLLGTSGALSIWAPIQPALGVASLLLLAGTATWRLRQRATGATCAV